MTDRRDPNRDGKKDRRYIERFSDPRIGSQYQQIMFSSYILAALSAGTGVKQIVDGLFLNVQVLGISVFLGSMYFVIATLFFRYGSGLKIYLHNESVNNLNTSVEKQLSLFMSLSILGLLFFVIQLIF